MPAHARRWAGKERLAGKERKAAGGAGEQEIGAGCRGGGRE